ncbi:sensor histidine kinase [Cellulomonas sp. KRMCY2]|uniref:sensor histidine kinase n=1 Tax=Cellulomonas sp. KRMCY2 TaxID=1304865 RepID=UPI0004A2F74B|nr:histidine kinase [Cellulomonas sp. KRMCY2]
MSLWVEPAVKDPPARGRRDWALAAIVMVGVALEAVLRRDLTWPPVAVGVGCGVAVAVLYRRSHALIAVALAFGALAVLDVAASVAGAEPVVLYSGAVVLVLAYALFRWGAGRDAAVGLGIMLLAVVVSVLTDFTGASDAIGGAAVVLFAAVLGVLVRYRAAAREKLVDQAKLEERAQLARELHDTVAHHVSAIAIQAQAGLFVARSGSSLIGATEALEIIDREAAQTLAEMRTMVGALRDRDDPSAMAPQRRVADIERLAARSTGSLHVDVALSGELANLHPAVEAALYRVAQESVTNARRHAQQATRVEVAVIGGPTEVEMTVDNDGARPTNPNAAGYGLVGMTERVTLLGGTFSAGPRLSGGWGVRAVLPRRGPAT